LQQFGSFETFLAPLTVKTKRVTLGSVKTEAPIGKKIVERVSVTIKVVSMRKAAAFVLLVSCLAVTAEANNRDVFHYDSPNVGLPGGGGTDYGQPNWNEVTCDDLDVCVSVRSDNTIVLSMSATKSNKLSTIENRRSGVSRLSLVTQTRC
jgi:hypothetical protein